MKKNIIFIAIMIIAIANSINAQQMYGKWVIPTDASGNKATYELTFWSNGITSDSLDVTSNTYPLELSAGGFSDNYDLQFYILGNQICFGTTSNDWINDNLLTLFPEYQIIKCPGSTNEYFAFSSYAEYHEAMRLSYSTITYNPSTQIASASPPTPFREFDGGYGGFAISPKNYSPRYIYAASTESETPGSTLGGLYKWTIINDGLSQQPTPIVDASHSDISDNDFSAYNLEYKIDDNNEEVFAWIHGEGSIEDEIVIVIDGTPNIITHNPSIGLIGGIEFSALEDNMLYASCDIGIIKINYITGDIIQPPLVGNDYNKTFLQTAPDGHIYGVSNNGNRLGKIIQWGNNAGSFVDNAFIFPAYANVATFSLFNYNNDRYYILPENSNTYSALNVVVDTTDVSCPGASDGEVIIYVSGGVPFIPPSDAYTITCDPNINFTWNEDGFFEANNLWEDTYYYTITDDAQPIANVIQGQFIIDVDTSGYTHGAQNITIEETDEWSNYNESYFHGFTILSGVELTITNSIIQFGANANIIIQPSAKLILDNSTLSDYTPCNDKWQGIQVWGIDTLHQYSRPNCLQGKLVVQNGSVIENAVSAVELWKPNDKNTTGGIVVAYDSYFINNTKSIHAVNYHNYNPLNPSYETGNLSYIKNCTFDVNSNYIEDQYTFYKHIDLAYVKGIDIEGCDFSLSATVGVSPWNIGIAAYDAGFRVLSICTSPALPCTSYDSSSFTGFYNGIRATSGGKTNNTFSVYTANFINNSTGIYVSAVNNAVIVDCDFEIGQNQPDKSICGELTSGFGIDIHSSFGFVFENNEFEKYEFAPNDTYTGIRVYDCRSPHDIIYKNTFTGLSFGNYAEGTNRGYSGDDETGVEYRCNKNFSNAVDFQVDNIYTSPPIPGMIRDFQGDGSIAASNWFSQESVNLMHFVNLGTQNVTFKYYVNDQSYMIPDSNKITDYVQISTDGNIAENLCPDHYGGGGSIKMTSSERADMGTEFANNFDDYNSVLSLYESFEDGGNTTSELLDIETAQPDDMWALKTQLHNDSPHLSQKVLMSMSNRTDVFPDYVLFEILAENPDELKEDTLIRFLESKENPLPDYMINILKQLAYTNTTYKTILINDMAHYYGAKMQAAKRIVHSILIDSVVDQSDFRNWLYNMESIEADKQIIASYLSENDTVNAMALLNLIPSLYELEGDGLDDFNNYKELLLIQLSWKNQRKTIFDLDSTDILTLEYYADNTVGDASYTAKNILSYAYDHHYCDCLSNNDSTYYKSGNSLNYPSHTNFGLSINVNPNPASTWVAFDYNLANSESIGIIRITDITGKEVIAFDVNEKQGQMVWDTRTVKPGVYIYTLTSTGYSTSGKLIIK